MKCISCGNRKAKRYCPALRASICPVCCGEKRGVEINCPLDCVYYVEGQKQQQLKVMYQRLRKEGAVSYVRRAELYNRNPEVFAKIEKIFAHAFRVNSKLRNEDVVSALGLVKSTLDTEKKGLIYQHQSENSFANELSTRLLIALTDLKDSPEIKEDRVTIDFASSVIEEFLKEARFFSEHDSNPRSYLIHILRYHPAEEPTPARQSELIITP
ncbi:MAG: hypothetical protein ACHQ6U_05240 [Thermodesulfobacteriota bacterium]